MYLLSKTVHSILNLKLYSKINKCQKSTVKLIYDKWLKIFQDSKLSEPKESIDNIIANVLNIKRPFLTLNELNRSLNNEKIDEINKLCELRLRRMPVQYVIGEWQFRDLNLKLKPPVFIPRPETEQLVSIVLDQYKNSTLEQIKMLELCCGSGAISLALLKENAKISSAIAVDQSPEACQLTQINAELNGIDNNRLKILNYKLTPDSLLENINDTFDLIVSNPPYVLSKDLAALEPEILLYEDLKALDGGSNGLNIIMMILELSSQKLNSKNGNLFLEIDSCHPPLIDMFLKENNNLKLKLFQVYKDFYNKNRFVKIIKY